MKRLPVLLLFALLCAAGCGDRRVAKVAGRVTVDGKPVADLRVSFAPVGTSKNPNPGPPSIAYTDSDGRFALKTVEEDLGAIVGACRVRISVREVAANDVGQKLPARNQKRLPARFNEETTLTFEVPPEGTDQANFDISWK